MYDAERGEIARLLEQARAIAALSGPPQRPGFAHQSFLELVLASGRVFRKAPRPDGFPRARPGRCFHAASATAEMTGLAYVEGLALIGSEQYPFEHAWVADEKGNALDPSMPDIVPVTYVGLAFDAAFRREQQTLRGTHAVIAVDTDGFLDNTELLRTGLPQGALLDLGEPLPQQEPQQG
jgi:hypothetical protein